MKVKTKLVNRKKISWLFQQEIHIQFDLSAAMQECNDTILKYLTPEQFKQQVKLSDVPVR